MGPCACKLVIRLRLLVTAAGTSTMAQPVNALARLHACLNSVLITFTNLREGQVGVE